MVQLLNSIYLGAAIPSDYGKAAGVVELLPFDYYLGAAVPSHGKPTINVLLSGVSPLTLLNAVELNYIKAFGKCEQRNLPVEYVQVNGVTNDSGGYIDTGIVADVDDMEFDIVATINSSTSISWYILQSRATPSGYIYGLTGSQNGNTFTGAFSGTNINIPTATMARTQGHTYHVNFVCKNGTGTITVDDLTDGTTATATDTYTFKTAAKNIGLFSNINGSGTVSTGNTSILSAYIKKSGVKVMDYVSCTDSNSVAGFYNKATNSFVGATEGGMSAGTATVPTPTTPVDIVANNGVIKYGKPVTLDATRHYAYISANDTWKYSTDSYSIVIPVEVGQKYKITADTTTPIGEAANGILRWGFIDNLPPETWKVSTGTPPNPDSLTIYDYVRTTPQDTPTVEITATRPYMVIQMGSGVFADNIANGRISVAEQTIYYDGTVETVTTYAETDITNKLTSGYYISDGGNLYQNVGSAYSDLLPVVEGVTYGFTVDSNNARYIRVHGYDSNGDWKVKITMTPTVADTNITFTIPTGVAYVRYSGPDKTVTFDSYTGGSATCQPLLSVGTYKDMQNITNGAVTRNVGIKSITGDIVTNYFPASNRCTISTGNIIATRSLILCTHFPVATQGDYYINHSSDNQFIYCYSKDCSSLDDYRNFFNNQYNAGTPVIVVYPLEEPVTETVTEQTLDITQGTNIVTAEGSVDDLELEVSYKGYAEVTVEEIEAVNTDENVEVTIS